MLEKAGYEVYPVMELADADRILRSRHINLTILCHTLSKEQQATVLATAHQLRPTMKMLLLTAAAFQSLDGTAEEVFYTFAGPRALVATINRLMGRENASITG
ncbi:hypothetical protein ACPOL_1852 [Acidisarcina polymorpha]|uniref:Uncharacterized protein n=2 Tax=Acidisarcina polymorpha TaxID=2211140 RepID=A0A2Z5FWQ7_9BACT|nr:hypothetical protein ACPOL_1852 [Acidisarcina polymorpha]